MKKDSNQTRLTPLENALQRQFNADAGNYQTLIKAAYERTTKIQSSNIAAIVGFGLLALSIKPQIGYGKFGDWLADTLGGALSKSAAYSWIKAAEWLAAKIANADKQTDVVAERICQFAEKAGIKRSAEEIFADAETTSAFVSYVSEGLPFRTFLNILKTANAAALEAEDEERKAKEKSALTKRDLKGLGGNGGGQSPQMLLWEDWEEKCESVDMLLADNRSNELLDPEHWLRLENKVSAWLDEIRKITKSLR